MIRAGIVIIKTNSAKDRIVLDETDRNSYIATQKGIFAILTHYEWPTSLLYASLEEQNKLFASKENAEVIFIQEKLNAANFKMSEAGLSYKALYIPDTVYQLAVIAYYTEHLVDQSQDIVTKLGDLAQYVSGFLGNFLIEEKAPFRLKPTQEYDYTGFIKIPNTFAQFLSECKKIYDKHTVIAEVHFLINNELAKQIINKHSSDQPIPSATWKLMAAGFLKQILAHKDKVALLPQSPLIPYFDPARDRFNFEEFIKELDGEQLRTGGIVDKLIDVELEARKENKAVILNASKPFAQPLDVFEKKGTGKTDVLTSTLKFSSLKELVTDAQKGIFTPHAVSYGLFPFTGIFYCKHDMPYDFASEPDNYFIALKIDKKQYATTRCNNLFIIPPFSALTQLFGLDTMYHVVSTVAMNKIPTGLVAIDGFEDPFPVQDSSSGTLIIKMDPIKHAELSADFAAKNFSLLKVPYNATWKGE